MIEVVCSLCELSGFTSSIEKYLGSLISCRVV